MSFDQKRYHQYLTARLQSAWGWPESLSESTAKMAVQALYETHGGERHYVPARKTDNELIKAEAKSGLTIGALSRRHALTERQIRRILAQSN